CCATLPLSRLTVFMSIEPDRSPLYIFKVQNHNAHRLPIAFQCIASTATDNVFSSELLHCRAREPFVIFVADGIGDLDFNNDVGWHILRCCQKARGAQ